MTFPRAITKGGKKKKKLGLLRSLSDLVKALVGALRA